MLVRYTFSYTIKAYRDKAIISAGNVVLSLDYKPTLTQAAKEVKAHFRATRARFAGELNHAKVKVLSVSASDYKAPEVLAKATPAGTAGRRREMHAYKVVKFADGREITAHSYTYHDKAGAGAGAEAGATPEAGNIVRRRKAVKPTPVKLTKLLKGGARSQMPAPEKKPAEHLACPVCNALVVHAQTCTHYRKSRRGSIHSNLVVGNGKE